MTSYHITSQLFDNCGTIFLLPYTKIFLLISEEFFLPLSFFVARISQGS